MYSADIYNTSKEKVAQVDLDEKIFGCEVKPHLLYEAVKMQLANRRSGTAATKNKALVSGGGKKPWRQKGTGRARVGSIRSPLWRSGGTVFGPLPRSYAYKMSKKMRKSALRAALSMKLKENKLLFLNSLELPEIKTKAFIKLMSQLEVKDGLIIDDANTNLEKSARNVSYIKILRPEGLNVYDILKYDTLVITQPCLEKIVRTLSA